MIVIGNKNLRYRVLTKLFFLNYFLRFGLGIVDYDDEYSIRNFGSIKLEK
jgi:hypothetical protein